MSAGLPYLQKQRKSELTDIAQSIGLKDYEQLKKTDLEVALDEHLRANQSSLAGNKDLNDYYKRFSTSRTSPIKRDSEGALVKASRGVRRQTMKLVGEDATSEAEPSQSSSLIPRTPSLSNLQISQRVRNLPPSPAAVTDAIDRQTTRLRTTVAQTWEKSGITEYVHGVREALSSVTSIDVLILLLELLWLRPEILPSKYAFSTTGFEKASISSYPVMLPDMFLIVSGAFWAPFTLWLLTSLLVPLLFAYFFNLSLKTKGSRGHPAVPFKFDPLVFNVTKAIVSYLVYAQHFTFWNTYSHFTIERVATNVPGGYVGLVAGSAIAGAATVYEAILRK